MSPGSVTRACHQVGQRGSWTLAGLPRKGLSGVMLARPIQVESCITGPERRLLGFLGLRVEGKASGWFHRAAITSRSRRWMDNGSAPDWPNNACEAPHNWTATFFANFSIIASTLP